MQYFYGKAAILAVRVCALQLKSHDYLPYCCNLLGQLPTSELLKFLRMQPSGLESADEEEQVKCAGLARP